MRNPFHSAEELLSAEQDFEQNWEGYAKQTDELKSHIKTAQVVFDRSNRFTDLWQALDESLAPAQAFLHEQVYTNLKELLGARRSVLAFCECIRTNTSIARWGHSGSARQPSSTIGSS
jgi:hypothetical protein